MINKKNIVEDRFRKFLKTELILGSIMLILLFVFLGWIGALFGLLIWILILIFSLIRFTYYFYFKFKIFDD